MSRDLKIEWIELIATGSAWYFLMVIEFSALAIRTDAT